MRRLRFLSLALGMLVGLAGAVPAQAGPLRFTLYDCGVAISCDGPLSELAQFTTAGPLTAPAVPPAGSFSAPSPVAATQILAGAWSELDLMSFNNNSYIGSMFMFHGLVGANGVDFPDLIAIGPATVQGLRLDWSEGAYLGLGRSTCLNSNCTVQTTIQSFSKLVVEAWTPTVAAVPEPAMPATVAAALVLCGLATRRRAGRARRR